MACTLRPRDGMQDVQSSLVADGQPRGRQYGAIDGGTCHRGRQQRMKESGV